MPYDSETNLGLPETPFGVPEELEEQFQKIYNAITKLSQAREGTLTETQWINVLGGVGFQNGWANFAGPWPASFRKVNNIVYLRGVIGGGAFAVPAFALPVEFRPPIGRSYLFSANSVYTPGTIQVDPTGAVTPNGGNNVFITLDGMYFFIDS